MLTEKRTDGGRANGAAAAPTPNHAMQRTASQRACARCFAAADRQR
jgi:hypothetical protein